VKKVFIFISFFIVLQASENSEISKTESFDSQEDLALPEQSPLGSSENKYHKYEILRKRKKRAEEKGLLLKKNSVVHDEKCS